MPGLRRCCALCFLGVLAIFASCLSLAQSPDKPITTASVEGTVAAKGLPDVTVRLERVPTDPLSPFDGYLGTVEPDGQFHFEDVTPGDYRLTASSSSLMHGEFGSPAPGLPGAILELKAGEDRAGLALNLFADPVGFCGRVLDADGNPLRTDVEVYGPLFVGNAGQLLRPVSEQPVVLTNPDGYFLLSGWLIPDVNRRHPKFFLRANVVWYPSTENFANAIPITASPISESGCKAVIQMPRTRCTGYRVTGTLEDKLAAPPTAYAVSLYEVNPTDVLFLKDTQPSIYNTGRIEFDNVCDGAYAIVASNHDTWTWAPGKPVDYASKLFHVESKDTDVPVAAADQHDIWKITHTQDIWLADAPKLPPPTPASLQGSLALVDGFTSKQACGGGQMQQPSLRRDDSGDFINTVLDKDGHFSFDKLAPGAYTLNVGAFAHGAAYLKTIQLNGQPLPTLHFTLAEGEEAQMKVEVSNDPNYAAGKPRAGNTEPHYLPPGTHPAVSIQGKVTGPDAAGAELKLSADRFNSAHSTLYETAATSNGSFHFDSVEPGIYKLTTEGEHHQYSEYGAKGPGLQGLPIDLSAGQRVESIGLHTYARYPLCGRVLDPAGAPRAGIEVSIEGYGMDAHGQTSWSKHTVTDAQGRYEFPEAGPGNFALWALVGEARTWFPSNVQDDKHYAPWVDLGPKDAGCVYDIYLRGADGSSFKAHRVTVSVNGKFDPSLGDRFYLEFEPADRVFAPLVERVQVPEPGAFTLQGVWPGKYTLSLYGEYGNGTIRCPMPSCGPLSGYYHHLLASQSINVSGGDLSGLKLTVGSLPTLDGEVLVDGRRPDGNQRFAPVLTGSLTPAGSELTAQLDADGHFTFKTLEAAEYGLNLSRYPMAQQNGDRYYIKSVLLNGKPIEGRHFQLTLGQSAHLTIDYASDGSSGTLRAGPEEPPVDTYRDHCAAFPSGGAIFLMIPNPLPADNSGIIEVWPYDTGDTRRRDLAGVPSGKYYVLAVENFSLPIGNTGFQIMTSGSATLSNHADLVQLGALGKPVEVKPGQQFDFTLPVVTAQMRRLMAEMGTPAIH